MKPGQIFLTCALCLFIIVACSPSAVQSELPATEISSSSPTQRPTRTQTITPTRGPTWTPPVLPPTSTPAPTLPANVEGWGLLSAEGPWFYAIWDGLILLDPQTGGWRRLSENYVADPAASPRGPRIAYMEYRRGEGVPFQLTILDLPNLTTTLATEYDVRDPSEYNTNQDLDFLGLWMDINHAISYPDPLHWSPDGESLAFVNALGTEHTDLYVFDLVENELRRLSSGPRLAVLPSWSPDGRWIVYGDVASVNEGSSGKGAYTDWIVWKVNVQTGENSVLFYGEDYGKEFLVDWLDADHAVFYSSEGRCWNRNLRVVNIRDSSEEILWGLEFYNFAYSPHSRTALLGTPQTHNIHPPLDSRFCGTASDPGLYLYNLNSGTFLKVLEPETGDNLELVSSIWIEPLDAFLVQGENSEKLYLLYTDGRLETGYEGVYSPNGGRVLREDSRGDYIVVNREDDSVIRLPPSTWSAHWMLDDEHLLLIQSNPSSVCIMYLVTRNCAEVLILDLEPPEYSFITIREFGWISPGTSD